MDTIYYVLLGIFVISTVAGYMLITNVPSKLHTPLMSGMNALSGITLLGALISAAVAITGNNALTGYIFGGMAIVLAMINVAAGFAVTGRMLKFFERKKERDE